MPPRVLRWAVGLGIFALLVVAADAVRVGFTQYRDLKGAQSALSAAAIALKPGLSTTPEGIAEAARHSSLAREGARHALATSDPVTRALGKIPGLGTQVSAINHLAEIASSGSDALIRATSILAEFQRVRPTSSSNVDALGQAYAARLADANAAIDDVDAIRSVRRQVDLRPLLPQLAAAYRQLDAKLGVLTSDVDLGVLKRVGPVILGVNRPTRYVLVLADNAELRPGGGFIGSYGTFGFDRGKLSKPHIENIYKLEIPIESTPPYLVGGAHYLDPPEALRGTLHGHSWLLRDASWFPDWPGSARLIEERFGAEAGGTVDGVVQIDPSLIASLLEATGPLDVPGFPNAVTATSLVPRTIAEVERPGADSINRKAFISAMGDVFFQRITALPSDRWPILLKLLAKGAKQKHILAYVNDPAVQAEVFHGHFDGGLRAGTGDALSVNLANVGINKDDFWSLKTLRVEVNPADGKHKVAFALTNKAPAASPGGPYVGYLRFYLPKSATDFSGKGFLSGFVDYGTEGDFAIHGGYITVPVDSTGEVDISYTTSPFTGSYQFNLLKQPGEAQYPVTLTVARVTNPFKTDLSEDWRVSTPLP